MHTPLTWSNITCAWRTWKICSQIKQETPACLAISATKRHTHAWILTERGVRRSCMYTQTCSFLWLIIFYPNTWGLRCIWNLTTQVNDFSKYHSSQLSINYHPKVIIIVFSSPPCLRWRKIGYWGGGIKISTNSIDMNS